MSVTRNLRKKSQIWNFFTSLDNTTAICDICKHKLCYRTSTSNLKKHLRRKHHTLVEGSQGEYVLTINKIGGPVEDGEIVLDPVAKCNGENEKSIPDTEQVPMFVEFVQENVTVETGESSPQPPESSKCLSACSSSPLKNIITSGGYKYIPASASTSQDNHITESLQMERNLKRKILETELEMKREELNFKKCLYKIQLEQELKVNELKLKMMKRDLSNL